MSTPAVRAALFFLAAFALYGVGLGDSTLFSRDETTYADIARHMVRSGDWLTLYFDERPWFNHPPFYYWLMAIDFRLMGFTELAARLPAAIFGALGVSLTYLWATTIMGPRGALIAGLAMMLNVQYFVESRMAIIDSTFLFFLSATMLGFWMGWRGAKFGWPLFFAACGMACLAKGPWGIVFPLAVVVPYAWWRGEARRLREIPWGWGLPLTLLIGGTWYGMEIVLHGSAFSDTVLGYYFLGRITTQVEHQGGPPYLYLGIVLGGLLPWSFMLGSALLALWRRHDDAAMLIFCWAVIPFVGLSLAPTKLPSYAAFVFAPCVLAVAMWIDDLKDGRPLALPLGLAGILSLGLTAALHFWGETHLDIAIGALRGAEVAFSLMAAGCLLGVFAALEFAQAWRAPLLAAAGVLGCLLTIVLVVMPALEPQRSLVALREAVRQEMREGEDAAFYGPGVFGVIYYADRGRIVELVDIAQLRDWVRRTPGGLLIVRSATLQRLPPEIRVRLRAVGGTPVESLMRVDAL